MSASEKDRQFIERCCNLIVRGTQIELHSEATSVDVAAGKETVAFAIKSIVDHVAWARADERLKVEMANGGAS